MLKGCIPSILAPIEKDSMQNITEIQKILVFCIKILDERTAKVDELYKENQQLRELVSVFVDSVLSRLPESILDTLSPDVASVLESLVRFK